MTHRNRARLSKLSLALIAALAAAPAFAQSTSAGIGGHVAAADGQPVAGAEVTITHVESGTVSRAVTDASGNYSARGLRVGGPYTITINKAGAGTSTKSEVYLSLNQVADVDATLNADVTTLGGVAVYADATADIFQSGNKGLGTIVGQRQLETTPQGNRSIDDVARLDPRIQVTDQGDGSISANGMPNRYNNVAVDGMSQGDPYGLNANGLPYQGSPISVDTIAEYNIATANFDVDSDTVGADINAVTKSGTNEFHGSAYYAFRNASSMVGKLDGDKYTGYQRDWTGGLTLGGPIVKDKLFFFLSAEQQTTTGIGANSTNGLDASLGTGPSTSNKLSPGDLQQIIDTATGLGLKPGTFGAGDTDLKDRRYLAKLDWNISDTQRASLTYQRTKENQPIVQGNDSDEVGLSSYWYNIDSLTENTSLQLFSDWTDNFSTEAKVSYQKFHQDAGNPVDQPQVKVYADGGRGPAVNLGKDQYRHYNVIDTKKLSAYFAGTWYLGDHEIKGGVAYDRTDIYNLFGRTQFGNYTFNSIEDFANLDTAGNPDPIYDSFFLYQPGDGMTIDDVAAQWVYTQISPFLQDTWQATDRLSLQYGLRVNIPRADHKPAYNAAFADAGAFGYPNNRALDSGDKVIEPRFSFNYEFDTKRRTQLRGGIGLFQTFPPTVWMTNPYQNNGITVLSYSSFDPADAPFSADPYNQNVPTSGGSAGPVDTLSADFHLPTVWKTALALDHELPWWNLVASAEFQYIAPHDAIYYTAINLGEPTRNADGSLALMPDGRLQFWCTPGEDDFNHSGDANCYRNRAFSRDSTMLGNTNNGGSSSLTLSLTKPFTNNWYGNLSLNLANTTEVNPGASSQAFSGYKYVVRTDPNTEVAATADREIDKSIKASLTWQHAFFGDYKTSVSAFYNGHSGLPYSWIFSGDSNGDGITFQDPAYIPTIDDPLVSYGSASPDLIQQFQDFISSDDYLNSHRGQIAGRNDVRAPWVNQLDLGIQQELPGLFKDHKATLRLDVYNFLNMLNNDWGITNNTGFNTRTLTDYSGVTADGRYVYRLPTDRDGNYQPQLLEPYDAGRNPTRVVSRWSLLMTLRYEF
jgi:hypothetical protein